LFDFYSPNAWTLKLYLNLLRKIFSLEQLQPNSPWVVWLGYLVSQIKLLDEWRKVGVVCEWKIDFLFMILNDWRKTLQEGGNAQVQSWPSCQNFVILEYSTTVLQVAQVLVNVLKVNVCFLKHLYYALMRLAFFISALKTIFSWIFLLNVYYVGFIVFFVFQIIVLGLVNGTCFVESIP